MGSSSFDINTTIEKLKRLKKAIDDQIQKLDDAKYDRDIGITTDDTEVNKAQAELARRVALIDKNIIENVDIRKILTENSSEELTAAIAELTSKAFQETLVKNGIDEKSAKTDTAKTMEQLSELGDSEKTAKAEYKFGSFDERMDSVKKIIEEEKEYAKYEKVSKELGGKEPSQDLYDFETEAGIFLDKASKIEKAKKYNFKGKAEDLHDNKIKVTELDKKETQEAWKEMVEALALLKGSSADVTVKMNRTDVKISELSTDLHKYSSVREIKEILERIHKKDFVEQASNALAEAGEKNKKDFETKMDGHKVLNMFEIENPDGSKQPLNEKIKESLKTASVAEIQTIVEEAYKMDNVSMLDTLSKVNPDKYKEAKVQYMKLQARYESGIKYDGVIAQEKEVKELDLSTQLGLTDPLKIVDEAGHALNAMTLRGDDLENAVETTFASLSEEDMEDSINKVESENKNLPRNIPVFSWIKKHILGQPTRRDLAIQDEIKSRIKSEINVQTGASKAEAATKNSMMKQARDDAFALDEEEMKKFRDAERKIIIESKGTKKAEDVAKEARDEAEK